VYGRLFPSTPNDRQFDGETGALILIAFHVDQALHLTHQIFDNGKS
jgi:hypothetical protein